ncbi:hypothetical protein HDU83_006998 [Entophlyctis luteolus]|nr:hypothetical protein HDU83_006998 [Entophlyctis luteolus]
MKSKSRRRSASWTQTGQHPQTEAPPAKRKRNPLTVSTVIPAALAPLAATFRAANSLDAFRAASTASGQPLSLDSIARALPVAPALSPEMVLLHAKCIALLAPNIVSLDHVQKGVFDTDLEPALTFAADDGDDNPLSRMSKAERLQCGFGFSSIGDRARKKALANAAEKISAREALFRNALADFAHSCNPPELDQTQKNNTSYIWEALVSKVIQKEASGGFNADFEDKIQGTFLNLNDFLAGIKNDPGYRNQIPDGCWKVDEKRHARFGTLINPLPLKLQKALLTVKGISRLYEHQAEAINELDRGNHILVSTSTARYFDIFAAFSADDNNFRSGKSLIYQVETLKKMLLNPAHRSLYLFPTKALAHDQHSSMEALMHAAGINGCVAPYDGDTSFSKREEVLSTAKVLLTNFDMLHRSLNETGIFSTRWREVLKNVAVVVVDELHYYAGTRFGVHCAMIIRRLKRIFDAMENVDVRFIACSATIGEADGVMLMSRFFALKPTYVRVVSANGAAIGRKHWLVWNPPLLAVPPESSQSDIERTTRSEDGSKASWKGKDYLARNPNVLFNSVPTTQIPDFGSHLDAVDKAIQCATTEHPLTQEGLAEFVSTLELQDTLAESVLTKVENNLRWDPKFAVYFADTRFDGDPARTYGIRDDSEEMDGVETDCSRFDCGYRVVDVGVEMANDDIEYVEYSRVFFTLYEGAIFIHKGQSYLILEVDHTRRVARAQKTNAKHTTRIRDYAVSDPHVIHSSMTIAGSTDLAIHGGLVKVTTISTGFNKLLGRRILEIVEGVGAPAGRMEAYARGLWIPWQNSVEVSAPGLHAAQHAIWKALTENEPGAGAGSVWWSWDSLNM